MKTYKLTAVIWKEKEGYVSSVLSLEWQAVEITQRAH